MTCFLPYRPCAGCSEDLVAGEQAFGELFNTNRAEIKKRHIDELLQIQDVLNKIVTKITEE